MIFVICYLIFVFVADGVILFSAAVVPRYLAALLLFVLLPGWAWLRLFPLPDKVDAIERIALAVGTGYSLSFLGSLAAHYLPGPLTPHLLLLSSNLLVGLPLAWGLLRWRPAPVALSWPSRGAILRLALLLAVAGALRFVALGYAEFHEDEIEVTTFALRAIKGEDFALFLHRKGPVQMVVVAAFWLLGGRIDEGLARMPFALAGLAGVLALYLLGRRMWGERAGLLAGAFAALNGYLVAFGRMVQYQSFVFFLGALAVYCYYCYWRDDNDVYQLLGALFLAASLLAHYDALPFLPAVGYIYFLKWRSSGVNLRSLLLSLALFLAVLCFFYIPFVLDPQFVHTYRYLADSRVGGQFPYDNTRVMVGLDGYYSSRFYLPLLAAVAALGLLRALRTSFPGGYLLPGLAVLLAASPAWLPWRVTGDGLELAFLPFLLLTALVLAAREASPEVKAAYTWFAGAYFAYVFLVKDPRTHLYILYPGWSLLAGSLLADYKGALPSRRWRVEPHFRRGLAAAAAVVGLLCLGYLYLLFLQGTWAYQATRYAPKDSWRKQLYERFPDPGSYFSYPARAGWKAIGQLYEEGALSGDYRSANEMFSVPIWYTHNTPRSCYDDPALYFVRGEPADLTAELLAQGYARVGVVLVEGQPGVTIYRRGGAAGEVVQYALADYEAAFDAGATPPRFAQERQIRQPLQVNFGGQIDLLGYDLETGKVPPGGVVRLSLFWRPLQPLSVRYRAFVHVEAGHIWGQQDDDPACRLPTTEWRAGQLAGGQFRFSLDPATPPGAYPLIVGLYDPQTGERLPVLDQDGKPQGDSIRLAEVAVEK